MWKKRLEGFYYGLLFSIFFYFMEYWQTGHVGTFTTIFLIILPFLSVWWFTSKILDRFYNKD